jgi:hypothetical protein
MRSSLNKSALWAQNYDWRRNPGIKPAQRKSGARKNRKESSFGMTGGTIAARIDGESRKNWSARHGQVFLRTSEGKWPRQDEAPWWTRLSWSVHLNLREVVEVLLNHVQILIPA